VKRSLHFPRLTTDELQGLRTGVPAPITKLGSWGTPAYLLLDAAQAQIGDRLDRGTVTANRMLDDLAAAQKKLGPSASMAVYREFAKALQAVHADNLAAAVQALPGLDKVKGMNDPMKKEAEAARAALTARGEEKLEAAGEDADALQKLALAFKGHPLEKKIREKIK